MKTKATFFSMFNYICVGVLILFFTPKLQSQSCAELYFENVSHPDEGCGCESFNIKIDDGYDDIARIRFRGTFTSASGVDLSSSLIISNLNSKFSSSVLSFNSAGFYFDFTVLGQSNTIELSDDEIICSVLFCPKAGSLDVDFSLSANPGSFWFYATPSSSLFDDCDLTLPSGMNFEFENYYVQGKVYRPSGHCSSTEDGLLDGVTATFIDLCNGEDYDMTPDESTTSLQGRFQVEGIEDSEYRLILDKSNNPRCGVNFLDILIWRNFYLGKVNFTQMWELIAADVNRDGIINPLDLYRMRQVLLGKAINFPENWAFLPLESYPSFPIDGYSIPTIQYYQDHIPLISDLTHPGGSITGDWLGIKIGDVNGSCTDCDSQPQGPIEKIETIIDTNYVWLDTIDMYYEVTGVTLSNIVEVDLNINLPSDLNGLCSEIQLPVGYTFEDLRIPNIDEREILDFDTNYDDVNNILKFIVILKDSVDTGSGVTFELELLSTLITTPASIDLSLVEESGLNVGAINDFELFNIKLEENTLLLNETFDINVFPNPAFEVVRIQTSLVNDNEADYFVLNSYGEVLRTLKSKQKSVDLNVSDFVPGMYFVRVNCNGESAVKKFIKLE